MNANNIEPINLTVSSLTQTKHLMKENLISGKFKVNIVAVCCFQSNQVKGSSKVYFNSILTSYIVFPESEEPSNS